MDDATYTAIKTVLGFLCPLFSLIFMWPIWLAILSATNERKALRLEKINGAKSYAPTQVQQAKTPILVTTHVETRLPPAPLVNSPSTTQAEKPPRRRRVRTSSDATAPSIADPAPAHEGGRKPKTNYAVVRNAKLRKAAIKIHGRNCCACRRNFDEMYGPELAKGYIEIHHLNRIAAGERTTDPVTDLAPLCSNCHTMADRLSPPPRTIAELRYQLFPEFRLQEKEISPAAEANKSPVKIRIGKIRERNPKKDS